MDSRHYSVEPLTDRVGLRPGPPRRGCPRQLRRRRPRGDNASLRYRAHAVRRRGPSGRIVQTTGRLPALIVNSHWHLDHVLGNQVYADVPTVATRRTREILLERYDELSAEVGPAAMEQSVRELEELVQSAGTNQARSYLERVLATHRWALAAAPGLHLTPPGRTFEGRFELPVSRHASLSTFGSGHTESDAVLHLPEEGVLFAGDLVVVGTHPNLTSGDPEHWISVLDDLERLHPERIVPGHGPASPPSAIGEVREILPYLIDLAASAGTPELPAQYAAWTEPGQFDENMRFLRGREAIPPER